MAVEAGRQGDGPADSSVAGLAVPDALEELSKLWTTPGFRKMGCTPGTCSTGPRGWSVFLTAVIRHQRCSSRMMCLIFCQHNVLKELTNPIILLYLALHIKQIWRQNQSWGTYSLTTSRQVIKEDARRIKLYRYLDFFFLIKIWWFSPSSQTQKNTACYLGHS